MNSIHILLVEDNEGDIFLITEALEEGKIVNKISVSKDGKEAIDFLEKKGKYKNEEISLASVLLKPQLYDVNIK